MPFYLLHERTTRNQLGSRAWNRSLGLYWRMPQAAGFQTRQHFDNYQQVMGRVVQDALTQQDKDRCMGVTYIRVRPPLGLQIENTIRHFCFSTSDEKQK